MYKKTKILFLFLLLFLTSFLLSCSGIKKESSDDTALYTVKVVNDSIDKALLRFSSDSDLSYTFKFVDKGENVKFTMNGNLTIQYSLVDYDDAKIIKIKQDTFIHIRQNDIIIDELPNSEKIKIEEKVLEKTK